MPRLCGARLLKVLTLIVAPAYAPRFNSFSRRNSSPRVPGHRGGSMRRRVWIGVLVFVSLALLSTPASRKCCTARSSAPSPMRRISPCRRDRHDYACRNQSSPRDDDQRDRQLHVPERRRRHLSVDVTLPGFQSFRAQDIAVRLNTAVRVDAKLSVGTLQESVSCPPTPCCSRPRPPRCRRRRPASSCRTCRSTAEASRAR